MARIDGIDSGTATGQAAKVRAARAGRWGSPLPEHQVCRRGPRLLLAALLAFAVVAPPAVADEDVALTRLLSGSHVALMRHALAPGTGDPGEFALGDCATQRNLSEAGREQARRIGERLRAAGVTAARVYSSEWCRCMETARLLGFGPVEALPIVNSFYRRHERRDEQTEALRAWLGDRDLSVPTIVVTHQVNISALTGQGARSGAVVVLERGPQGKLSVGATVETD